MTTANLTREECALRGRHISVHSIHLDVDLRHAGDKEVPGFGTTTTLVFESTTDATWIDFLDGEVHAVEINGAAVDVDYDGARIYLRGLAEENTVVVRATGQYSRSGEGLHRFFDPADGECYLYTQYEPADARRVMACFEQPDLKFAFTAVVHAPTGWEVLSNQDVVEREVEGEWQRVEFAPTLPISSYITALAAGPYHRVESEWTDAEQSIPLAILSRQSLAVFVEHEQVFEVTRQGLDFFTENFGYRYPWGKYDQIFVPEYNLGAMENPGLVTFTEAYISRGARTDAEREALTNTVLHEMAHMWFGDLVTMRWWADLWLKESFADYMGTHASATATRFTDAWASFAIRRKAWAYQQDQLPTTHPIVADIPDLEAAKLNFDGITYAKGASVLKQLVAFVGEDAFFRGARSYFAEHAFGNTTLDDLLRHLSAASGRDLAAWSAAWLETTGLSTFTTDRTDDQSLVVQQDVPRPHRIRVGAYQLIDGALERTTLVDADFDGAETTCTLPDAALTVVNADDLSYAKARLDDQSVRTAETHLSGLATPLERAVVWSALWNATRDGEYRAARFIGAVGVHAPVELHPLLQSTLLAQASFAVQHYVAPTQRPAAARAWLDTSRAAMDAAAPASDTQLTWARTFAAAAALDSTHHDRVRELLEEKNLHGLTMAPDLRWALLTALVTTGDAGVDEIEAEALPDHTSSGRIARLRALASRPDADVRAAAWESAWKDAQLTNDELDATVSGARAGGRRDLIEGFDEEYFDRLVDTWAGRSIELARRIVIGLFPTTPDTTLVDTWLASHSDAPAALRRLLIEQRDHLVRELAVQAVQERIPASG